MLAGLSAVNLRGYRALWHYLAGAAGSLGAGVPSLVAKSRAQFDHAKGAAVGIPWLVALARFQPDQKSVIADSTFLMEQLERVEAVLAKLGTIHDRSFAKHEKEILEGLALKDGFERAQKLLGEIVGFDAGKVEADGSPDPWWIAGNLCLVFEDHAGAQEDSALDVTKARQASSHPAWMRANVEASETAKILPVLVTPVTKVKQSAVPHLDGVALWPLDGLRQWAENALAALREIRKTFVEPGDLIWRAYAAEVFEQHTMSATKLFAKLASMPAVKLLEHVK